MNLWQPQRLLYGMLAANVAMFVIALLHAPRSVGVCISLFGFLTPGYRTLLELGASGAIPVMRFDHWWTLLTANYVHTSLLHLGFNMLVLYQMGSLAMHVFGPQRMFTLYTLGGIFAILGSCLAGTGVTAGASGALCALAGGLAYFEWRVNRWPVRELLRSFGVWVLLLMMIGLLMPRVDNWAHLSGLAAGALIVAAMESKWLLGSRQVVETVAASCVAGTVAALVWVVVT